MWTAFPFKIEFQNKIYIKENIGKPTFALTVKWFRIYD